ncbi:sulfotransferase [Schleiferiaceae bacterium]|nr:sulfotransferase [Schleiferiaceae bacterium]
MKVNLFVVGFPKAGTTTIYNMLQRSSKVSASRIKEPNYFIPNKVLEQIPLKRRRYLIAMGKPGRSSHLALVENDQEYHNLFNQGYLGSKYYMEASSAYCMYKETLNSIYSYNNKAKVICIVRHPVERVLSHYRMDNGHSKKRMSKSLELIKKDFDSNAKGWMLSNLYIEFSQLRKSVEHLYSVFEPENVLILNFNDLENQNRIKEALSDFLTLDLNIDENIKKNITQPLRWKILRRYLRYYIGQNTRKKLKKYFFRRDVEKFEFQDGTTQWLLQTLDEEIKFYKTLFPDAAG